MWKALNIGTSLTDMFKRVEGNTRQASQGRIKVEICSKIRESSFIQPSAKLWNLAPITVVEVKTESQAIKAIREFAKTLPL